MTTMFSQKEGFDMEKSTALITGAASGIGRACAIRMAREGYSVAVADVNLPAAEDLAAELTDQGLAAVSVRMDVSDEREVEAGFDRMLDVYGSCDLVMSNAGIQIVHPFDEYPFEDWKKMMAIHADGFPRVPRRVPPHEGFRQGRSYHFHRVCAVLCRFQAERTL